MLFWRNDYRIKWFGADVGTTPKLVVLAEHDLLVMLLADFNDIFESLVSFPPQRHFDHRIHLLPGLAPVAVRP